MQNLELVCPVPPPEKGCPDTGVSTVVGREKLGPGGVIQAPATGYA